MTNTLKCLKAQHTKRVLKNRDYTCKTFEEHRSPKTGRLVMSKDGRDEVEYLTSLLTLMIVEDGNRVYRNEGPEAKTLRSLVTLCPARTAAHSIDAKVEKAILCAEMAKPVDDPQYVKLAGAHEGKLMYDDEADPLHRALRIIDITFTVYRNEKYWMATCIENVLSDNGTWIVPKRCYVTEGKAKMMDPDQLRDYVLINVTDEENPKTADDVDIAIAAHVEREINRLADSAAPKKGNKRGLNK